MRTATIRNTIREPSKYLDIEVTKVAPPSQKIKELSQQQLIPNTTETILATTVFLYFFMNHLQFCGCNRNTNHFGSHCLSLFTI